MNWWCKPSTASTERLGSLLMKAPLKLPTKSSSFSSLQFGFKSQYCALHNVLPQTQKTKDSGTRWPIAVAPNWPSTGSWLQLLYSFGYSDQPLLSPTRTLQKNKNAQVEEGWVTWNKNFKSRVLPILSKNWQIGSEKMKFLLSLTSHSFRWLQLFCVLVFL